MLRFARHINGNISGSDIKDPFVPERDLDIDGHSVIGVRNSPTTNVLNAARIFAQGDATGGLLRDAMDELATANQRGIVWWPPGDYNLGSLTEPIVVPPGISFLGSGIEATRIMIGGHTSGGAYAGFILSGNSWPNMPATTAMQDLTIYHSQNFFGPPPEVAVLCRGGYGIVMSDVEFVGIPKTSVRFLDTSAGGLTRIFVHSHRDDATGTYATHERDYPAIEIRGGELHLVKNVFMQHTAGTAILLEGCERSRVIHALVRWATPGGATGGDPETWWGGGNFDFHGGHGVHLRGCVQCTVAQLQLLQSRLHGVYFEDCINCTCDSTNVLGFGSWYAYSENYTPDPSAFGTMRGVYAWASEGCNLVHNHARSIGYTGPSPAPEFDLATGHNSSRTAVFGNTARPSLEGSDERPNIAASSNCYTPI
jgi:hypothetical protein